MAILNYSYCSRTKDPGWEKKYRILLEYQANSMKIPTTETRD